MPKILFLDTETTGSDPELAKICEIGVALVHSESMAAEEEFSILVDPGEPIPPEASAVHHITNDMLLGKHKISDKELIEKVRHISNDADYFCAHNLPYDMTILKREMPSVFGGVEPGQCIDTLRWSRHILRGIPSHALQVLRYRYEFNTPEGDAHRALFDVKLCTQLFSLLMKAKPVAVEELPEKIAKPLMVDLFNFGKYRGSMVDEVVISDPDYIRWLMRQDWMPTERPDLMHTISTLTAKKR